MNMTAERVESFRVGNLRFSTDHIRLGTDCKGSIQKIQESRGKPKGQSYWPWWRVGMSTRTFCTSRHELASCCSCVESLWLPKVVTSSIIVLALLFFSTSLFVNGP